MELAQGHSVGSPCVNAFSSTWYTDSRYAETTKVLPNKPEWVDVFRTAQDTCPNVLQLMDLLLSLPASSADCERGFSLTKVIKSDWRSRLRDTMVTDLMTVQLHSPEIGDFDPASSILRWKGTCKRRLSQNISDSNSDDEMESECS